MTILFLSNINSVLVRNLAGELVGEMNAEIAVLDIFRGILVSVDGDDSLKKYKYPQIPILKKVFVLAMCCKSLVRFLFLKRRDAIMIHYVIPFYGLISWLIRLKSRVIISTLYGSDFYLVPEWKAALQSRIFRVSRSITFSNLQMSGDFAAKFPQYAGKMKICRFGLPLLNNIDEFRGRKNESCRILGLPTDKIIIACGHSSSRRERHLQICTVLNKIDPAIKQRIHLVFPLTYNLSADLHRELVSSLTASGISFKLFTDFLSIEEMAALRISTEIMLNLPESDQMTAAMLETLYAGGLVITGNWLPYQELDEYGISYLKVPDIASVIKPVSDAVMKKVQGAPLCNAELNREIIHRRYSWESNVRDWISLL